MRNNITFFLIYHFLFTTHFTSIKQHNLHIHIFPIKLILSTIEVNAQKITTISYLVKKDLISFCFIADERLYAAWRCSIFNMVNCRQKHCFYFTIVSTSTLGCAGQFLLITYKSLDSFCNNEIKCQKSQVKYPITNSLKEF